MNRAMKRVRRAITLHEQQAAIYSEKGACHPDDWETMDERFNQSRAMLERVIQEELDNAQR